MMSIRASGNIHTSLHQRGFTLVELMISVSLLSIVVIGVMESLTQQQKTSLITEQVVEVQNNTRAISALLEREIRMAGFMVPNAVGICGLDRTLGSDELFISEVEPIVPDNERAGTLGARLGLSTWDHTTAVPAPMGLGETGGTIVDLNLDAETADLDDDDTPFYDNDGNGVGDADFRVNGGFILADMGNPDRGSVCGTVVTATAAAIRIRVRSGQLAQHHPSSDAPEEIVVVPAAHYWINPAFTTGRFERNGDLLANGIDDFQVSYFFDVDDDGVVDGDPGPSAPPPPPLSRVEEPGMLAGTVYAPLDWDNSTLKEVRYSISVRTRMVDQEYGQGSFQVLENRVDPTAGANDGLRRRVISGRVRPRNIGHSGSI